MPISEQHKQYPSITHNYYTLDIYYVYEKTIHNTPIKYT